MADSKRKEELDSDLTRDVQVKGQEAHNKSVLNNALGDLSNQSAQAALGSLYSSASSMTQLAAQMDSKVAQDEQRLRENLMKEKPPLNPEDFGATSQESSDSPFDTSPKPKK
jgi:predicted RNA-binding protein with PIN domain